MNYRAKLLNNLTFIQPRFFSLLKSIWSCSLFGATVRIMIYRLRQSKISEGPGKPPKPLIKKVTPVTLRTWKLFDLVRRHEILLVFSKCFFSVCDRVGPDIFIFMKTLGVFLLRQTVFDCPTTVRTLNRQTDKHTDIHRTSVFFKVFHVSTKNSPPKNFASGGGLRRFSDAPPAPK